MHNCDDFYPYLLEKILNLIHKSFHVYFINNWPFAGYHGAGAPPPYSQAGGYHAPPPYGSSGSYHGAPPAYSQSGGYHAPPPYGGYGGYGGSHGSGFSSQPGHGYNPSYGHSPAGGAGFGQQPQTVILQGGSSRPGIGQLAKEAFVFAGVSAGVNAAVNRLLPGEYKCGKYSFQKRIIWKINRLINLVLD